MIVALASLALAAIPEGVRPAAAPHDAPELYAKAFPDRAPLACATLLDDHAKLCFRVWDGKKRRWVNADDLKAWKTDTDALVAHVKAGAAEVLVNEPKSQRVVDYDASYLELRDGDGWAVAPLLRVDLLQEKTAVDGLRVAIPRSGVFLAWPQGSPELDKIMAVAVREIYEAADDAVTPMVHSMKGGRFVPFGQANPAGG